MYTKAMSRGQRPPRSRHSFLLKPCQKFSDHRCIDRLSTIFLHADRKLACLSFGIMNILSCVVLIPKSSFISWSSQHPLKDGKTLLPAAYTLWLTSAQPNIVSSIMFLPNLSCASVVSFRLDTPIPAKRRLF